MAYQPNIPGPNTNLSVSQGDLLGNFQALNTVFGVDHNQYNAVSNAGTHLQVTMPSFGTPGSPGGTASVLYTKNVASSPTLYFKNGTADSVVWTGGSGTGLSTVSSSNLTLPNGLQFSYGMGTTNGSGNATVTFNFPNNLYSATLTRIISGGNNRGFVQWASTPTKTSGAMTLLDSSGTGVAGIFYWMAIGN